MKKSKSKNSSSVSQTPATPMSSVTPSSDAASRSLASKSNLWIYIIIAVVIVVIVVIMYVVLGASDQDKTKGSSQKSKTTVTNAMSTNESMEVLDATTLELSDRDMALALLTENEIATVTRQSGQIRSAPVEFNDHLEEDSWDYVTFVARITNYRSTGTPFVENAVTRHLSTEGAQQGIVEKAGDYQRIDLPEKIGDSSLAYFIPAGDGYPAAVGVRFTYAFWSAKVFVYDVKPSSVVLSEEELAELASDDALITELTPLATALAKKQLTKVKQLASGDERYLAPRDNVAVSRLPHVLPNSTYIGEATVTDKEWFGMTKEFDKEVLPGFISGGLVRHKIDSRKDEVVEIILLEFDAPTIPDAYKKNFVQSGGSAVEEITLPAHIDLTSDAIIQDTIAELQSAQGNYLIDVSIFSPFNTIDREAATQDLLIITDYYLKNFFGIPLD
ncbi:MAG: hypothetical protein A3B74_00570 [Candidatus Kerfeldbacteria bacterium RIFCSPHIGHO2_02_FULL_42_14]|uniref:Uncharacterized protein n=1 Tax=Candidatus Kerfeldbacteria bacterium RIFCSPHIGHO2_02_FULL_42_14 TaxID=1798540 RepID=A0A1G2AS58_9BACT|nr:MAG: hypothetical protein A3B74_00570 [Candidatus Kerfeldbacteria bacterium RIFCSPHIGHO2_02_FULL_42_14]OGY81465.1 MAG: hypothetical protein A3E60_05575 [Candidatus Kerfeldbacteria bacterium RIFCSPHIGHO2_12_FULL_42_13]OGY83512.1 MAG: hypothetical protein A3I91_02605 [Candidatus Kerfeldbacteria bacterium RIFCSPLOWO2_02_FULL_42_19]OGY86961.1 MAG: hypothetical protein A3G01_01600 [Candidatus Kerfeldbacteria bacterium RIFCSPLOWO2_12_FULL_43_9]